MPRHGLAGPGWLGLLLALAPTSFGCTLPAGKLGDVVQGGGSGDGGSGDDSATVPPESERVAVLQLDDGALDVLLVLDNSGSMGLHQINATEAIVELATAIEARGGDLRLGVTTTDNGNPWCQGTGPESGNLRMSSCRSRAGEFVFEGVEQIDVTAETCLDRCGIEQFTTMPTSTHVDSNPASRPWIELSPGADNLAGNDVAEVLRCVVPQGIDGCGFESHLESMVRALDRTSSPSDPAHGFLRPWARLAVVMVTDEVDCSVDSAWEEIFLPDSDRVFWSDQNAPAPTSAVCWNAGVECDAASGDLGSCTPQNYDVEGNVTNATNAVMRSLTHYAEELAAVEASKAAYHPEGAVAMAVVAGVPPGYFANQAELSYSRGLSGDADFIGSFGVDPGCTSTRSDAVPPVRLRALAEQFTAGGQPLVSSVCADDFAPPMAVLADALATPKTQTTACVPGCLADVDADADGLQTDCRVVITQASGLGRESSLLPECGAGTPTVDPCYRLQVGAEASACAAEGSNAQLELVQPQGAVVQGEVTVEIVCEMTPAGTC